MSLKEYKRKRDFKKTPEPAGKAARSAGPLHFVVQKHAASRLHYDFRLELDGALKSWAVPKGPCLDPSVKALAVHVEDHPLDYANFEGLIPQGQYGGGTVMVWDRGTWTPEDDNPSAAYKKGRLKFTLHGEKLKGSWALVRMGGRAGEDGKNWLLIKHDDKAARPLSQYDVTVKKPKSVVSKRTIEQIAKAADRTWSTTQSRGSTSRRSAPQKRLPSSPATRRSRAASKKKANPAPPPTEDAAALSGARRAPLPSGLQPQLATLAADPPPGERWIHELKFDGYRMLAFLRDGRARLVTRNGNDWTARFGAIADRLAQLPVDSAVLDGEVVSLDARGVSNFQQLQNQLKRGDVDSLAYYLFDLPYCHGYDLTAAKLVDRKQLLQQVLAAAGAGSQGLLRYSEHIVGNGAEVLRQACRSRLEGIICKRMDAAYQPGRSPAWLKVKCTRRQEFVIGGYTPPSGSRIAFGALLLGYYDHGKLLYAGKVGTGFTAQSLRDVHRELLARRAGGPPFDSPPRGATVRGVAWVRPELVAEVEFTEWTEDGQLRHPSFQGLRDDKSPKLIVREKEQRMPGETAASNGKPNRPATPARRPAAKRSDEAIVAGVAISSPDKLMYPGYGVTKLDLARYYESVAQWIMPFVERRPLTLVRCPEGQARECFYQKHLTDAMPKALHGVTIKEKDSTDVYVAVADIAGVISLVQMGVLEIHPWPAREDKIERPDMLVFDLDPGEGLDFSAVVQAARDVRESLEALGLKSFLRTSGGKGLHVVAPLSRRNTWDDLKQFARGVAESLQRAAPDRYVVNMSKAKRQGKIFVDYLRNQRGATAVASYSTRARPGAPIATPISWDELTAKLRADQFNVANIHDRLKRGFKDPWKGFFKLKQSITRTMLKTVRQ
ncbi:MAG: DNA ligase D [Planctomycetota bacterium]|nr:MAG: DNA ligase D [Planctomycetota bacterium]